MPKIFTALDLGSFESRAILVKTFSREPAQVLGVGRRVSKGIKKGVVIDITGAAETAGEVLRAVENTSGVRISEMLVAVNGTNISSVNTKGVIAVSRADHQITQNDIERAIKSAQATLAVPNREIISVIPRGFTIDTEEGIRNPIGMNGIRLEAETLIVSASSPFLRNLSKAVTLSGWKGNEFVPGAIACGEAFISKKQKELGIAVLDIGSDTTSIVVYEEGEVLAVETLPVGSSLITSDIAIGLRIDIDTAETIKVKYGTVLTQDVRKTEVIELRSFGVDDDTRVRRSEVAQIIEARIKEILALVSKSLNKTGRRSFLPAGIILVGGGSKLEGLVELTKQELKLPVRLGYPEYISGLVDEVADPSFAKVVGIVAWKLNQEQENISQDKEESYSKKAHLFFQELFHKVLP